MRGTVVLIIVSLLGLVSCAKRAPKAAVPVTPVAPKPVAPTPSPPPPLSTPQTRVELPEPQPLDPAALKTESTAQDTPPVVKPPAAPRRPQPAPAVAPPATPPPAATAPAESPRIAIQEVISPTEFKRLQDQVQGRRREVNQILEQLSKRKPVRGQQTIVNDIRNFMALSDEAEKRNDIRQADAFAERAQILARDLQNGK
uniref:Uncharacterized protein n=1 Tax=Solibacter usitatus (strain Ellin6076) TaxID=234267 RepID=Q01PT0_SOLUE